MKPIFSLLFAGCFVFSTGAFAAQITGYVSESMCGAKHSTVSAANTKCIKKCLKGGSSPVLVSDGKVIDFAPGSQKKAKKYAGDDVTINGTENGNTVTIKSIHKAS
ncbi:MAG: hypothetical protein ACRD4O_11915 [Bryobacteraceae bacterium]